jgi:hypothetical protein
MKSSSALTAVRTVIRWLRWAAVVAFVYYAWGNLVYFALGRGAWAVQPKPLLGVIRWMGMLHFQMLPEAAVVVAGAMIAPRFRVATAIVLAASQIPLFLWVQVLSRASIVELVLLEGGANYGQFALESFGVVLGVMCILWSEKARKSATSAPRLQLSLLEQSPGSVGPNAALTAARTVIRWLRWAAVVALVYSAVVKLAYSALRPDPSALRPAPLPVVQEWAGMLYFHTLSYAGFVVAGAIVAPRARLPMAIVLAAALVPSSFWGHVLAMGGPWWFWTINYTHFSLEAIGSVLGVVYIFWSERRRAYVT